MSFRVFGFYTRFVDGRNEWTSLKYSITTTVLNSRPCGPITWLAHTIFGQHICNRKRLPLPPYTHTTTTTNTHTYILRPLPVPLPCKNIFTHWELDLPQLCGFGGQRLFLGGGLGSRPNVSKSFSFSSISPLKNWKKEALLLNLMRASL